MPTHSLRISFLYDTLLIYSHPVDYPKLKNVYVLYNDKTKTPFPADLKTKIADNPLLHKVRIVEIETPSLNQRFNIDNTEEDEVRNINIGIF